ncbi:hypothetical protein [Roseovarius rhodophyticola]|uniref:Uncharacterized protein n=1 Tax=Roseovarius rhodophyticola TaxID=3080827 RepID=A0ABZ2THM2_9RHOB|nr:hypothetical protein [Roseovarius sp. W115]
MGSFRRGLIFFLALTCLPLPALAEVCDKVRPGWDGAPVSIWQETLWLFGSPAALFLLFCSALVWRFKNSWGALAVFVGWSFLVGAFTFWDPTGGQRAQATAEGCIGSPSLFVAVVLVISVGLLLYTGKPDAEGENGAS